MYTVPYGSRSGLYGKRSRLPSITPDQFRELREFTGKTRADVARLVGVSLRTVGNWETGAARPSYAAYRLLRVILRGDTLHPGWEAYRFIRGKLVTPEGRALGPGDLSWLSLLVQRANFQSLVSVARLAGYPGFGVGSATSMPRAHGRAVGNDPSSATEHLRGGPRGQEVSSALAGQRLDDKSLKAKGILRNPLSLTLSVRQQTVPQGQATDSPPQQPLPNSRRRSTPITSRSALPTLTRSKRTRRTDAGGTDAGGAACGSALQAIVMEGQP